MTHDSAVAIMHSFYFWMRVNSAVRKREERVLNAPLRENGAILHAGSDARKQEIRARPPLKGLKEQDYTAPLGGEGVP